MNTPAKHFLVLVLLLQLAVPARAQQKLFLNFFEQYSGKDGFTTVNISSELFRLMRNLDGMEDIKDIMDQVNSMHILLCDHSDAAFQEDVERLLDKGRYKEITTINDSGDRVRVLSREQDGAIAELLLLNQSKEETSMVLLSGQMDKESLSKLSDLKALCPPSGKPRDDAAGKTGETAE